MLKQVRGTKDLIADEYRKIKYIYDTAYKIADNYGFTPIETPIIEYSEVFTKTLGEVSDIITKEMYTFLDKNENNLTLRPEFTAAIARAFITNHLEQLPSPLKLICHGPLFRYERPQKGRQRQFNQINCEILGEGDYLADIEAISLAVNLLKALKIENKVKLELNSLGDEESYNDYRTVLTLYLEKYKDQLSIYSQKRLTTNPLRILDSKDESDKAILKDAPKIYNYYSNYSVDFFSKVKNGLDQLDIKYTINPHLVRGLDYYSHTTFEFTTDRLEAQNAVIAGGRYDKLIEIMGGKNTPAIGFAAGIERISELTEEIKYTEKIISIIPMGEEAINKGIILAHRLRSNGITIHLLSKGNLNKRLKKSETSVAAIIIGEKELKNNQLTLKNMKLNTQKQCKDSEILAEIGRIL
ncbi:MAG: histidine--tRNA ligase [Rickettsiaceae bacterium H1]|nr:histidine--tRNA ligase [Rickettsiaceae bacterium H1]